MNRIEALAAARVMFGDLGMISHSAPVAGTDIFWVWKIGEMDKTIGKGKNWEEAIAKARA